VRLSIVVIVALLVVFFVFGFPLRRRLERAWTPPEGPSVLARRYASVRDAGQRRLRRRRRRHLRSVQTRG
jgi:hypothetical protein